MTILLDKPASEARPPDIPAGPRRRFRRRSSFDKPGLSRTSGLGLGVLVLWLSLIVLLPLAAVVGKAFGRGFGDFVDAITDSVTADALKLTVLLAIGVAIVNGVMGTLIAWVLVRERFRGSGLLGLFIDIPFALPTIVAGLVMLSLIGNNSPIGVHLYGTRVGMFVVLLFVTLPFTVRTVQPVLLDLDRDAEQAAESLGAGSVTVFRRIVLPQIAPAAASGITLAFARALGEYGSLVLISSGVPHRTVFASSLIYGKLQDAQNPAEATQQAAAIATVLLAVSAIVLVLLDVIQRRVSRRG